MLKYLIEKEFKQLVRNSFLPKLLIAMPLAMMLIMPWAASQEIKSLRLSVVDNDRSPVSSRFIRKASASDCFHLTDVSGSYEEAISHVTSGDADIIMEIPDGFERSLTTEGRASVMLSANSVNGTEGALGASYLASVVTDFSAELREESPEGSAAAAGGGFSIVPHYRFNPRLDYKVFMVPAVMVMLLTLLSGFLPALNIVGEKEAGTIEQINVSPTRKLAFVLAKLIPYWLIGFLILTFCMGLAYWVYGLAPAGSLLTIYLFASVYLLTVSGMGLVISNYSDTVQQAMFVMFFFMLILLLMSGLLTPVSSMPEWAQAITVVNPLKYFIQVMRMVYLKGSPFASLLPQFLTLCCFAVVMNVWAVVSYKKNN